MVRTFGTALLAMLLAGATPAMARCGGPDSSLYRLALDDDPPSGRVVVQARVSAVFAGSRALNGFYLLEDGADGLPVGLFVYAPGIGADAVERLAPGTVVRLEGRLGRYHGQRQLQAISGLAFCGEAAAPPPQALELPAPEARLRRLAGLPVRIEQALTVTDNYHLGRYGSLTLVPGARLFATREGDQASSRLVLDDGSFAVNPRKVPYLDGDGTRRLGSRVAGVTGILAGTFGAFRVHPTRPLRWLDAQTRLEPARPPDGTGRIALLNAKNFFSRLDGRGARSANRRELQRSKLVAAINAVDADVLGLLEIENSARAVRELLGVINAGRPERARYRAALTPGRVGDDAIRAVLLYRPDSVGLVGRPGVLGDRLFERPPIWARFRLSDGEPLTIILAHLKSKGGCPPGQSSMSASGCWSKRRAAQAHGLVELVDRLPGDRELLLADLNAYAWERPRAVLRGGGLRDLAADALPPNERYTYVYRGRAGMLDYAMAGDGVADDVTGVRIWHLNADEPRFLGYRGRPAAARRAGPYRSSDHDMVIVDMAEP